MYLFRLRYPSARSLLSCALALFVIVMFQGAAEAARAARFTQYTFGTPEAAVEAMVKAFRNNNEAELYTDLYTLFGSGSGTMRLPATGKPFSTWATMTGRSRSRS
jgi:hypothetical protein